MFALLLITEDCVYQEAVERIAVGPDHMTHAYTDQISIVVYVFGMQKQQASSGIVKLSRASILRRSTAYSIDVASENMTLRRTS